MSYANALLTPRTRERLARKVVEDGWPITMAAKMFMVSPITARKWVTRWRTEGRAGMQASVPTRRAHRSCRERPSAAFRTVNLIQRPSQNHHEEVDLMRILLVGATGTTGLEIIRQALDRDIDVTAVVRSPEKLVGLADRISVASGSVFDSDVIEANAAGCDAALSSIGSPGGFLARGTTTVYSRAATALTEGLKSAELKRLVFCTSAGVEPHDPAEALPYRLIAKPLFLQRSYDDMTIAETIIRAAPLDWTLVRPARLTNGAATGRATASPRLRTPGGRGIARADVATFMLDQIDDSTWLHATPTLTRG